VTGAGSAAPRRGTVAQPPGSAELPAAASVLAVCAHPDDESFGLGAVLAGFVERGTPVSLLCFTRGEASTLGAAAPDGGGALDERRPVELAKAAAELGIARVVLLDHPDGSLTGEPLDRLAAEVAATADEVDADLLVVFDEGGITGHPDHCRATAAALAGAPGRPVLAWAVPQRVADTLNAELGTTFVGRPPEEVDLVLVVDRARQCRAIAWHASQCGDNPVLERRLGLQGDTETLRWLRRADQASRMNIRWTSSSG
jgi:LmbE family N-acetylglucosaminyl deacetylase